MDKKLIIEKISKLDYKTYKRIDNVTSLTPLGLMFLSLFVSSINPILPGIFLGTGGGLFVLKALFSTLNPEIHTKEISKIIALYKQFIKNYNELNKTFELKDPIEITTMFDCLLFNGYISDGHKFEFSNKEARDINSILGTEVVTGKGVCRHIATMLTDIFNDYGINAGNLCVLMKDPKLCINITKEPNITQEELIKWLDEHDIKGDTRYNALLIHETASNSGCGITIDYGHIEKIGPLKKSIGNHMITYAYKDGKNYFLDPTNKRFSRPVNNSPTIIGNKCDEIIIKKGSSGLFNSAINNRLMEENIKKVLPTISLEEEKEFVNNTKVLYKNNLDLLERFYIDNSELYSDLNNEIMKIDKSYVVKLHTK